jgi:predicted dehydrogenase
VIVPALSNTLRVNRPMPDSTPASASASPRLGLVGAGGIGEVHADAARRAGWTLAAIVDSDRARADTLAASQPGCRVAADLESLLADRSLDAIAIATPNVTHRPIAEQALAAGFHVLLEKPAGLNAKECDALAAAERSSGRILQIGLVCRSTPVAHAVKSIVASGRLGTVYQARASLHRRRGIPGLGGWFTDRSKSGGGPLIDLGVHVIDLVLHVLGQPKATRASGATYAHFGRDIERYVHLEMWGGPPRAGGVFDVEDQASAMIRFDGGMTFEVDVAWAANLPDGAVRDGIVLLGDRGGLFFEPLGREVKIATEEDGHLVDVQPLLSPEDGGQAAWRRQYEAFAAAIRGEGPPAATVAECRNTQAIIDAIYRSSAEGREVEV